MGTAVDPQMVPLLTCSETEFEEAINAMDIKELIETVSGLQKEMKSEQEKFDLLSEEIGEMTDYRDPAYIEVSHELVRVQNKLAMLMKRNMKCFNKQSTKQSVVMTTGHKHNSNGSASDVEVRATPAEGSTSKAESTVRRRFDTPKTECGAVEKPAPKEEFVIIKEKLLSPEERMRQIKERAMSQPEEPVINVGKKTPSIVREESNNVKCVKSNETNAKTVVKLEINPDADVYNKSDNNSEDVSKEESNENTNDNKSKPKKGASKGGSKKSESKGSDEAMDDWWKGSSSSSSSPPVSSSSSSSSDGVTHSKVELDDVGIAPGHRGVSTASMAQTQSRDIVLDSTPSGMVRNWIPSDAASSSVLTIHEGLPIRPPELTLDDDEKVKDKTTLKDWDPISLLKTLYAVKLVNTDNKEMLRHKYISMEGWVEKLPDGKKNGTMLKTWKKRYFRANGGKLFFYDSAPTGNAKADKATGFMDLMGGTVSQEENTLIGIDNGRSTYMLLRMPNIQEANDWYRALCTQCKDLPEATYIQPMLKAPEHKTKKVVVIDLGSTSIRAGVLGAHPSLPELFFPSVVAVDKKSKKSSTHIWGFDAFKPSVRAKHKLLRPIMPAITVEKRKIEVKFNIDMDSMPSLFKKIFNDLKVSPSKYWVMLSMPQNLSIRIKGDLMKILIDKMNVQGVNMVNQPLLALYSYNTTNGIVVDIGERLEVLPVTDGYIIQAGVTKQAYGGQRILDTLNSTLTEYRLYSDIDKLIVRYCMEKACYVADSYDKEMAKFFPNTEGCDKVVKLAKFDLPPEAPKKVTVGTGRFKSPEGLLHKEVWGVDDPSITKLIINAIMACPIDTRRDMYRGIYLSGGVTQLPGLEARIQSDLKKVVPTSVTIQVHTHPYRYHAAYIGACSLANMHIFENLAISNKTWKKKGADSLLKWQDYFQG